MLVKKCKSIELKEKPSEATYAATAVGNLILATEMPSKNRCVQAANSGIASLFVYNARPQNIIPILRNNLEIACKSCLHAISSYFISGKVGVGQVYCAFSGKRHHGSWETLPWHIILAPRIHILEKWNQMDSLFKVFQKMKYTFSLELKAEQDSTRPDASCQEPQIGHLTSAP